MARETVRHFENACTLTKFVDKRYMDQFTEETFRPGTSISIPRPFRASATSGATASFPDVAEDNVTLTVAQYNASFAPTSVEMSTSVSRQQWSERYLKPNAIALANQVDSDGFTATLATVGNATGTAGTTPSALSTYLTAHAIIKENGAPVDGDVAVIINPTAEASIVDTLKGLFHSSSDIEKQYKEGKMGLAIGAKWSMDQNVGTHTTGQQGGTPLVNTGSQSGATLITDGWTASAANRVKKGDTFTVAGVYAVNPVTKNSTGRLKTFVVTADTSSDGSGNLTIPLAPSIVTSGATQNVSGSPADNAAITMNTASVVQADNLLLHKDALTLAVVPMSLYAGLDKSAIEHDPDTGIAIRVTQGMDITNDKLLCRLDVLYGWAVVRESWICKVLG